MSTSTAAGNSDYLLDTLVTWQDVEVEMQKSLGTTAKFGEKKKVTSFGDQKGFMSRMALIEPDWIKTSDEQEDTKLKLPEKFSVKISSILGINELFGALTFLQPDAAPEKSEEEKKQEAEGLMGVVRYHHNLEVLTYDMITKENNPALLAAKAYSSKAYTDESPNKGFIITDFISNVFPVTNHDTVAYEEFVPALDSMAAFSAMGERLSEEEKKKTAGFGHLEGRVRTLVPESASPKIRSLLIEALGESNTTKIDKVMSIITEICGNDFAVLKNYSKIFEFLDHSPVLLHSDLWLGNMLFTKDSNGKLVFQALIDFQSTSLSSPGLDVAWVAVCCLNQEDRQKYRDVYLKRYFESFKAHLNLNGQSPYTFQHLQDSYELCFPPIAIQILPIIWSMTKHTQPVETLEVAKVKMMGLVEDLIEMHEANVKKFPEFFEVPMGKKKQ